MDYTRQQQASLRVGVDLPADTHALFTFGYWHNRSNEHAETSLRDTQGNPVYSGPVRVSDDIWALRNNAFSPSAKRENHRLLGLELDGRLGASWHWDATASDYALLQSNTATASEPPPVASNGGSGTIADSSGSGWRTDDLRLSGPVGDMHTMWLGVHADQHTPCTVHRQRVKTMGDLGLVVVHGDRCVLVAWIDKRDLLAAKAQDRQYLGAAVYYAWSDDCGASFARELKLADNSCECCRIELAKTPDGSVAAFWRAVYGDNIRDHAYAVLRDGGDKPDPARATFTDWYIEGCPHHGPGLAMAADGSAHSVWFSAKDDAPTIWYGRLDPGHAPRQLRKIAGAGAAHADISVDGKTVWIAWNQFAAEGTKLMLRISHDGGANFDSARAIAASEDATSSPQLLRWHDRTFVAWNTAGGFRLLATEATP